MSELHQHLNSATVTPDDLRLAADAIGRLAGDRRGFADRALVLQSLFAALPASHRAIKVQAIDYRLSALRRIAAQQQLPAKPHTNECSVTDFAASVWLATATEPLVFGAVGEAPYFVSTSFLRRACRDHLELTAVPFPSLNVADAAG